MWSHADPGDPPVNALGSRFVAATADADDGLVGVPPDPAHTVVASELASLVWVTGVRAFVDPYAAFGFGGHGATTLRFVHFDRENRDRSVPCRQ